jgi:hypothetical protein
MDCKIPAYLWSRSLDKSHCSDILNNGKFQCTIKASCQKDSNEQILEKLAKQYSAAFKIEWAAFKKANEAIAKKKKVIKRVLKELKNIGKKFVKNCVF